MNGMHYYKVLSLFREWVGICGEIDGLIYLSELGNGDPAFWSPIFY